MRLERLLTLKEYLEQNRDNVIELLKSVLVIESYGIKYAIRFEPRFYQRLQLSKEKKRLIEKTRKYIDGYVSQNTALMLLSCSYGYLQVLGYNFLRFFEKYEINTLKFHIDVYNEFFQCLYLIDFLIRNNIDIENVIFAIKEEKFNRDLHKFAVRYNGSVSYIDKLYKSYKTLQELEKHEKERFESLSEFLVSEALLYIDKMREIGVDK